MTKSAPTFARCLVTATLELKSPLSIRTGEEERADQRFQGRENANARPVLPDGKKAPIQAIEVDSSGLPFIPATAIKGLLRGLATVSTSEFDESGYLTRRILGEVASDGQGVGGIATFRNSYFVDGKSAPDDRPAIRGRTAIHRGSRTALDGSLRADRAVAPGARFKLEMVLDSAADDDVVSLRQLLQRLDGLGPESALGSGTGQGDGRIALNDFKAVRLTGSELLGWLKSDAGKDWRDFATPIAPIEDCPPSISSTNRLDLGLKISIHGHFLVSVMQEKKGSEREKGDPTHLPFKFSTPDKNIPTLPASSLDGALASQAERICRTISGDVSDWQGRKKAPRAFVELFGSTDRAGLLQVSHFFGDAQEPVDQDFVAIDRFTGGSHEGDKGGAKFKVTAFEAPVLGGNLSLVLEKKVRHELSGKAAPSSASSIAISREAIGLLALLLKDLASGDIPLGYGTRKGYGVVSNVTFDDGRLEDCLAKLGQASCQPGAEPEDPRKALKSAVSALVKQLPPRSNPPIVSDQTQVPEASQ